MGLTANAAVVVLHISCHSL